MKQNDYDFAGPPEYVEWTNEDIAEFVWAEACKAQCKLDRDKAITICITTVIVLLILALLLCVACLSGCSDVDHAKYLYFGRDVQVELWSHGRMIKAWDTSTLIFKSPRDVTFIDKETNQVVGVYGEITVKEKDNG